MFPYVSCFHSLLIWCPAPKSFPVLAIVLGNAMNNGVHVFFWINVLHPIKTHHCWIIWQLYSFFSGKPHSALRSGWAGHRSHQQWGRVNIYHIPRTQIGPIFSNMCHSLWCHLGFPWSPVMISSFPVISWPSDCPLQTSISSFLSQVLYKVCGLRQG